VSLPEIHRRYLRLLGIEGEPSGLEGLRTLTRAHLFAVPFENVSKLLLLEREGAGRFFTLPECLDGIEHHDLGGTCYSLNPYYGDLLRALGYHVDLLGADMGPRLNCHTSLRVTVDSIAYHVDVGYGGPFREPMRLDRLPCELQEGHNRYVLEQRGERYEMSVLSNGERVHGYIVHASPRPHEFFAPALNNSFAPQAAFLNCLRICRFYENYSVTLLDRTLHVHRGSETVETQLEDPAEWEAAFAASLSMPRCPAAAAIRVLERNTGKPFFGVDGAPIHAPQTASSSP
jgi:arylamine N-acetyltransferase